MKNGIHIHIQVVKLLCVLVALVILSLPISSPLAILAEDFDCNADKHDYSITTVEPTEDTDGERIYTCNICGFSFSRILPATGHSWGEWVTDKQPTCTTPGHQYRICTKHQNDPHIEEQEIPELGHKYTQKVTAPTCGEDGFITYMCGHCGDRYTEPFGKATGHHYTESIAKEPDCEHDGEKIFVCEHDRHTYVEAIPALGHNYGEWIIDKEPTEEEEGHQYKVCGHDSSHIIEETIPRRPPAVTPPPPSGEDEKPEEGEEGSEEQTNSEAFPNVIDITMISLMILLAVGYGRIVYYDIRVLQWDKKKSMTFKEWLDKHKND